jgi:hypothetical protein
MRSNSASVRRINARSTAIAYAGMLTPHKLMAVLQGFAASVPRFLHCFQCWVTVLLYFTCAASEELWQHMILQESRHTAVAYLLHCLRVGGVCWVVVCHQRRRRCSLQSIITANGASSNTHQISGQHVHACNLMHCACRVFLMRMKC